LLILASASAIRTKLLSDAGVEHQVLPASIDEASAQAGSAHPAAVAEQLAKAKAVCISNQRPGDWVIGSDSVVSVDGRLFSKPRGRDEAAEHLRFFSGRTMRLTSAVALATAGRTDWSHTDAASLQVRELSSAFIDSYLDREWPEVGYCVGVFRMEGPGVQLFDHVEGSHFTILGMPLLPLLKALRARGLLPS